MPKKTTFQNASNLALSFTQLLRGDFAFGVQNEKCSYHFGKYTYIAEWFTNVKLRQNQIGPYVRLLSATFRKIINADIRYRQRMDDLPAAVGCRAFGVTPLGGGWYSPNIKVATNCAQVLEYICRQWCKRTVQYPHTLTVIFDKLKSATKAMPKMPDKYSLFWDSPNRHIRRDGVTIIEEYHISMPFRVEYYARCSGFVYLSFGAACRVSRVDLVHFDNLNIQSVNIKAAAVVIDDFFAVEGVRAVQSWGHLGKKREVEELPDLKKVRKLYGGNTDKLAASYYRACKMGYCTFNAYTYGRLKALR